MLPIVEIVSPTGFYSSSQKEDLQSQVKRISPAPLSKKETVAFQALARRAMRVLHLYDVCRMDMRMDAAGRPFVLEVNPIPLMDPDPNQASLIFAAVTAGLTYRDVVKKIIDSAARRWKLNLN